MSKTKEKAKAKFINIAESRGFTVVGEYINCKANIELICPNGHTIYPRPYSIVGGQGCIVCSKKDPVTAKLAFIRKAEDLGFTILSEYKNNSSKVKMRCRFDHVVFLTPTAVKIGTGCSVCARNDPRQSRRDFEDLAIRRGFTIIGKYSGISKPVDVICPNDHFTNVIPNSFKSGTGCRVCAENDKVHSKNDFEQLALQERYSILGNYTNARTHVLLVCPEGHKVAMTPDSFKRGTRCSSCCTYGYDQNIAGFLYVLSDNLGNYKVGISNTPEKRISALKRNTPFPFELVSVYTGDGREVRRCERAIHNNYPRAYFSEFDGYTEWVKATNPDEFAFIAGIFNLKKHRPHHHHQQILYCHQNQTKSHPLNQ